MQSVNRRPPIFVYSCRDMLQNWASGMGAADAFLNFGNSTIDSVTGTRTRNDANFLHTGGRGGVDDQHDGFM